MKATGNAMRAARRQRRSMSPPEVKLWALLRRSPAGIRFRRQYSVGPFVADFYCPAAKLVIEVDGLVHDFKEAAERDEQRDAHIRNFGLTIIRIPARDVLTNAAAVADSLVAMCADRAGPSTT